MKQKLCSLLFFLAFIIFGPTSFAQYCTSNVGPTNINDSDPNNVILSGDNFGISNLLSCPGTAPNTSVTGVDDYTSTDSADISLNTSYSLQITFGNCNSSGNTYTGVGEAWIDWNGDGDFNDNGESLGTWSGTPELAGSTTINATFNFTVPSNATLGTSRLRVMQFEGGTLPLNPCATFSYGGVEDYKIKITNTPPPCPTPGSLSTSNVSSNSATVNWVSTGTSFEIEYGIKGFSTGTGLVTLSNTTSTNLTGISSNTEYDVYVKNICTTTGNGTSPLSAPISFKTTCVDIATFPYNESFEGTSWHAASGSTLTPDTFDGCWSRTPLSNNAYGWFCHNGASPTTSTGPSTAKQGANYIFIEGSNGSVNDEAMVELPNFDFTSLNSPMLSFYYHRYGAEMGDLYLEVSLDTGKTWTTVKTFTNQQQFSEIDPWILELVDLTSYKSSHTLIRFKAVKTIAGVGGDMAIDQLKVEEAPLCVQPTLVSITNATTTTAEINFTSTGASFPIEYGPTGFTQGTGSTDTALATGHVLTNLTTATTYDVYIRNDCSGLGNGFSTWSGPFTFSTLICDPVNKCDYTVILIDDYGDGWNGGKLGVYQNNVLVNQLGTNFSTGFSDTITLGLCDNINTQFILDVSGGFPEEIGLMVIDPFGQIVINFTPTTPAAGPQSGYSFGSFVSSCTPPACPKSTNVVFSNITLNSADVAWTPGNLSTGWKLEYGPVGFTQGTGNFIHTSTANASLTGLQAASQYDVYIQDSCSAVSSSTWIGPFKLSTLICPLTDQCEYEIILVDDYGDGWNGGLVGVYQNNILVQEIGVNFSSGFTDTATVMLCNSLPVEFKLTAEGLYSYEIGLDVNNPFGQSVLSYQPAFIIPSPTVGFSFGTFNADCTPPACPDPTAITASNVNGYAADISWSAFGSNHLEFVIEYGIQGFTQGANSTIDTVLSKNISLTGLTPVTCYDVYVLGVCSTSNGNSNWTGPYNFCTTVSCPDPSALEAFNITTTTADLTWTTGGANNWNYVYGPAGTTPISGTIMNATNDTVTLPALTSATNYHFWVRDSCGQGDVSAWVGPFSFITNCTAFSAPYIENFNNTIGAPICWNNYNPQNDASTNAFWKNTSTNWGDYGADNIVDHTGGNSYAIGVDASTPYSIEPMLETPMIDISTLVSPELNFWMFMNNTNTPGAHNEFQVDLFDGTAWQDSIYGYANDSSNWVQHTVDLSTYTITGPIQVRFRVYKVGVPVEYYDDLMIDDVSIDNTPACAGPTTLTASNITTSGVDLAWTPASSTATLWDIEYGPFGFNLGNGIQVNNITSSTYSLNVLNASTNYCYYVRERCANGVQSSNYVGPYCFNTLCSSTTMPYQLEFLTWPATCVSLAGGSGDFDWDSYTSTAAFVDFWGNSTGEAWMTTNEVVVSGPAEIAYQWSRNSSTTYSDSLYILIKDVTNATLDTVYIAGGSTLESNDGAGNQTPGSYVTNVVPISSSYTNSTIQVIFVGVTDYGPDLFIKSIVVQARTGCVTPSNEMAINIMCDELDLTWTSDASATNTGIIWDVAGFDPLTGGNLILNATSPTNISGLSPGTAYDFYIADSCSLGLSTPVKITATTASAPKPTIVYTATQTNVDATIAEWTFDATASTNYTSIDWNFGDGSTNGTNALETHNYSSNQGYTVTLTLTNGCGSVDTTFNAAVNGINIEENFLTSTLNVFPNPTVGNVNVEFTTEGIQHVKVNVINTLGQTIVHNDLGNVTGTQSVNIDLNGNASGIYLIQVITNKGAITKRVTLTKK